jgi:hypothetical protein
MTVFHRTLHIGNSARGKKTKQKVWCSKEQEKQNLNPTNKRKAQKY